MNTPQPSQKAAAIVKRVMQKLIYITQDTKEEIEMFELKPRFRSKLWNIFKVLIETRPCTCIYKQQKQNKNKNR